MILSRSRMLAVVKMGPSKLPPGLKSLGILFLNLASDRQIEELGEAAGQVLAQIVPALQSGDVDQVRAICTKLNMPGEIVDEILSHARPDHG